MIRFNNSLKGRFNSFPAIKLQLSRHFASATAAAEIPKKRHQRKMTGLQIHSYGDLEELQYSDNLKIPVIKSSDEVLVKVNAAGVNPIDIAMIGGYGSKLINTLRCDVGGGIEFPLTLGREFSGIICQKGMSSKSNLQVGDSVWGVVPVQRNGSHAEYVVIPQSCMAQKPEQLTSIEAGSVLYAGLTAWSGIFITGQLGGCGDYCPQKITKRGKGKHILVLGASGGVGSSAVQILKAEQATVIASCSTDAIPIVKSLGTDHVIDYTNKEELSEFSRCGPYDLILDCAGLGPDYANKFGWSYKSFVTFSSPLLRNIDEKGIPLGILKNLASLVESNARSLTTKQGFIKWGYFVPSQSGIEYMKTLIERKKFIPLIDSCVEFKDAIEAYRKVKDGHLRGKVVINLENQE